MGFRWPRKLRQADIVIHHEGAMVDFEKQILRAVVVVQQVASYPGALGHPIEPDAAGSSIDVVAADLGVDRSMNLDAGHLRTGEEPPHVDVMDGVAGDQLKMGPKLPTIPACSQCAIVLLRTMWWPMLSSYQPFSRARSIVLT